MREKRIRGKKIIRSSSDSYISSLCELAIIVRLYLITFRLMLPYGVMMHAVLLMSEQRGNEWLRTEHPFLVRKKPH